MLKKIVLSVLMVSAVLSGTAFAASSTPSVPTPPTPQALKNGSSSGNSGGSGTTLCSYLSGLTTGESVTLTQSDANNLVVGCPSTGLNTTPGTSVGSTQYTILSPSGGAPPAQSPGKATPS